MPQNTPINEKYFFIKTDSKIVKLAFDEVLFIEALQKYIQYRREYGKHWKHNLPISKGQKEGFMNVLKEEGLFFLILRLFPTFSGLSHLKMKYEKSAKGNRLFVGWNYSNCPTSLYLFLH